MYEAYLINDWLFFFPGQWSLIISCCLLKLSSSCFELKPCGLNFRFHYPVFFGEQSGNYQIRVTPGTRPMSSANGGKVVAQGKAIPPSYPLREAHLTIMAWLNRQAFAQSLWLRNHMKVSLHNPACPSPSIYMSSLTNTLYLYVVYLLAKLALASFFILLILKQCVAVKHKEAEWSWINFWSTVYNLVGIQQRVVFWLIVLPSTHILWSTHWNIL